MVSIFFRTFASLRWIIIISMLIVSVDTVRSQECHFLLSGHIQDADTRENLSGASIYLPEMDKRFVTDANGNFRYPGICAGEFTIEVSHAGCETVRRTVSISKNTHIDISLPHLRFNLKEVVVAAQKAAPSTGYKQELNAAEIELSKGFSLADALGKINGVNILQTGSTISKPVVHGLHSIRVLTINNGVRQEGQQWGTEHAPEIDTYIADRLTVIKGVDELKYGSDAIGGVVLVDPRPIRALPGYQAEFNTAYFTNNNQYVFSGIFEQQLEKLSAFSYRLQGTFKKGGNIKTPDYRLNNTGMEERNFSAAANWKKEHYQLQAYYSQFSTETGIFPYTHVGNISDLEERIQKERPDDVFLGERTYHIDRPRQEVLHRLVKLKSLFNFNEHKINITLAGQYNNRHEFDVVRNSSMKGPQISLALTTFSEEITYEHPSGKNFKGIAGISLTQQDNSYSGRYLVPNYTSFGYGAYWIEKWTKGALDIEGGLRFDNKTIDTRRLQYGGQVTDHNFDFSTFAGSLNAGFRFNAALRANAALTVSNRAPHVNELLSGGIHQASGGYSYLQGNIYLKTEKSVNIGGGISFSAINKDLTGEIHVYRNRINDFIYLRPVPDEPVLTVTGAAPQVEYRQTDATLTGADITVNYHIAKSVRLTSAASVLRARDRKTDDWLILMPADRWRNEAAYSFNSGRRIKDSYISAELVSVFRPRVPGDQNGKMDYKEPPGPYSLININASATFHVQHTPVTIGLSIRNMLDTKYRDYMNSFRYYSDEMGRNVILRLKIPFENFLR